MECFEFLYFEICFELWELVKVFEFDDDLFNENVLLDMKNNIGFWIIVLVWFVFIVWIVGVLVYVVGYYGLLNLFNWLVVEFVVIIFVIFFFVVLVFIFVIMVWCMCELWMIVKDLVEFVDWFM